MSPPLPASDFSTFSRSRSRSGSSRHMPSCRDSDVPPGLRPGSFSTRTSSDWHDAGVPVMAADEIRAALAEAGAWPRHAIRAELEARAEIMDLLRRGDG